MHPDDNDDDHSRNTPTHTDPIINELGSVPWHVTARARKPASQAKASSRGTIAPARINSLGGLVGVGGSSWCLCRHRLGGRGRIRRCLGRCCLLLH